MHLVIHIMLKKYLIILSISIKKVNSSFDSSVKLSGNYYKIVAQQEYTSVIRSLYIHYTRLDITFIVCKLPIYIIKALVDH
jgi:hypothetical protein